MAEFIGGLFGSVVGGILLVGVTTRLIGFLVELSKVSEKKSAYISCAASLVIIIFFSRWLNTDIWPYLIGLVFWLIVDLSSAKKKERKNNLPA